MTNADAELAAAFPSPSQDAWMRLVEKVLKGADFDKRLASHTADGIKIDPLYRAAPDAKAPVARPTGARGWQMRQLCIENDPNKAREVLGEDVAAGATEVLLRCEAPGQAGLPAAALDTALSGLPLARLTVALEAGERGIEAAQGLRSVWDAAGIAPAQRRASLGLDPIGSLARHGGLSMPLSEAVAAAAALASDRSYDGIGAILRADARVYHEAGATEAQELGAMLATLIAYLRALEAAGLAPAQALPRIEISLAADADLFLTIAKMRAARLLVRRLADASGGDSAMPPRLAATTSERMLTLRDPWVNLLRTCAAAMGAALGGADSITVLPFTFPRGRPDAFARRIARNMHVILAEESGLGRVADPAGGAWYIEHVTGALAEKAWAEMQAIEAAGGMAATLRSGVLQARVSEAAGRREKLIETVRMPLTGTSAYPRLGEDGVRVEPHASARLPVGSRDTITPLQPGRLSASFEALRDAADDAAAKGQPMRIFLAALGTTADHSARSTWIANFLASGGIEAIGAEGYTDTVQLGRAFANSGARIACLCSSDDVYEAMAEAAAGVLKQAGADRVYIAGRPKDEAKMRAAGVDAALFAGQDAVATLRALHRALAG